MRYLRFFLYASCLFGGTMFAYETGFFVEQVRGASDDLLAVLGRSAGSGLMFGLGLTVFQAFLDRGRRARGLAVDSDELTPSEARPCALGPAELWARIEEFAGDEGWRDRSGDDPRLRIYRTPITWRSWGERVEIRVQGSAAGQSILHVRSRPLLGTTRIDYGKNTDNVRLLLRAIVEPDTGEGTSDAPPEGSAGESGGGASD